MNDPRRHSLAEPARSRRLRHAGWIAAAIGLLATAAVAAQVPLQTVEECLETGTELVPLPGVAGGTLSASQCRGCETLRLKFDQSTRYYIGKELVPYARLRAAAAAGNQRIYVFYRPGTRILSRLSLEAGANTK